MKLRLDSADFKPFDTMTIPHITCNYIPPYVDRIWLWVYYNKIPIYPIFYLLKGGCIPQLQKKQLPRKDCEVAAPHRPGFTVVFFWGHITRI